MTSPTDATPQFASPEAQQLVQHGAYANEVDIDKIMAQMQQMQLRLQQLEAERGVPSDPIAGARLNLQAHIDARAAQYPQHDFSELVTALKELPDEVTSVHTDFMRTLVQDFAAAWPGLELGYLPVLASDYHKIVLKAAANAAA